MNNIMPSIGFGTWKFKNSSDTTKIITDAISCGYRLIDTASSYLNEEAIGKAISAVDRSKLFVSGKLWNTDRNNVTEACEKTISNLNCEHLDLYLMHWPASKAVHENWAEINSNVWHQMENLVKAGKVKNIGVSNFKNNQLEALINTCSIKPYVNQIEFHPGFMQKEIVDYCKNNEIIIQAWSPLRSGRALKKKEIIFIAEKYGRSPAQICLKWCIQNSVIPIVKSANIERMKSNLSLDFVLEKDDMDYLNNLPYMGSSGLDSETLTLFG